MLVLSVVLATLSPAAVRPVAAQEATPDAAPDLIADYDAALNAHDADAVAALFAENAVVEQAVQGGNVFQGRAEIRGWVAANLSGIPDLRVTTESVIAAGDRAAWAWVYQGAYTGQYPGLPAGQGQPVELRGASFFEFRGGQIVRETVYYDNLTFLTETGAMATPVAQTETGEGSVTIRVFSCPADLATGDPGLAELVAACEPFDAGIAPTLGPLPDGEPIAGAATTPAVYRWDDLPLGSYVISADNPADLVALRITDAAGSPLQNPVALLDAARPNAEYFFFYFLE
jgi:steroid delta-isomerase-like uncharacterized protein